MFRLLVIAKTEAASKEIASWAVSGENSGNKYGKRYEVSGRTAFLRVFPLWTDLKGAPAIGDALLIVVKTPEDLVGMESFVSPYKRIPIKFILCDGVEPQPDFESKWVAKSLKKGAPTELVEMIISSNNELVKNIAAAFKKFDKNNDGSIDLKEIQLMSKELGIEMSEAEATKLVSIMDVNKDGKISLEEFIGWWKTGCQGISYRINSMMKEIFKKNPEIQKVLESFRALTTPGQTDEVVNFTVGVYLGVVPNPGIGFDITLMSNGKELDTEFQEFAETFKVTKEDTFAGISFGVKNDKEACSTLKDVVASAVLMGSSLSAKAAETLSNFDFKYGSIADKAIVCAVPSVKGATNMAPILANIEPLTEAMLPNQSLTFRINFATDLEKMTVGEESLVDFLFDGANFDIIGKLHPNIKERIAEILQKNGVFAHIPIEAQAIIPVLTSKTFVNSVKAEIAFDPSQEIKEVIITNTKGPDEFLIVPFKSIRDRFIPMAKKATSSIPIFEMAQVFLKNQVSNIKIFLYISGLGAIKIQVNLPGLSQFLNY